MVISFQDDDQQMAAFLRALRLTSFGQYPDDEVGDGLKVGKCRLLSLAVRKPHEPGARRSTTAYWQNG